MNPPLLRIGVVGMDTSHVPAFTNLFNDPAASGDLAGFRVVAGFPDGSDAPMSRERIAGFIEEARGLGVEIVRTPEELIERSDCLMILSVDGRIHLRQVETFAVPGKPLFLDKPVAGSLAETMAVFDLVKSRGTPCFSSSCMRFGSLISDSAWRETVGEVLGASSWGPLAYQDGMPELFFYGIHGIEALFTVMGSGCESVTRTKTALHDVTVGVWEGGRVGVYRGILEGNKAYGQIIHGTRSGLHLAEEPSYEALCRQIGRFFRSRIAPVTATETLEIYAFMEAAERSLHEDHSVGIEETFLQAKTSVRERNL